MKKVILLLFIIFALCGSSKAQVPGSRPYPATSLDSPATLFEVRDKATTKLDSSISAIATTIPVESTAMFPSTGSLVLNKQEIVFYTGKTLKSFIGAIRAREGTAAVGLVKGTSVEQTQIAAHHNMVALQLIEAQRRIGWGASLPANNYMLVGIGGGATEWKPVPIDTLSDVEITSPSIGQVLKYDGTKFVNGSVSGVGTVTSIAASAAGIFSFGGSPITGAGTLALNVTGTSGGIPYFSSGSALSSSGALAANRIVLGGGAGAAPTALAFGTGNQLVGMNDGATANEYKNLAFGTSGTDLGIVHTANLITFNVPTASGTVRGVLSNTDWTTFNNKLSAISTVNDTNVTISYSSGTLTAGWTSRLTKSRQYVDTVYNDQANTFGNFVQTFQAGANHLLVDPTDTTKKFQFDVSNIATATTRTVNIPNANSTTVQPSSAVSNQFLTAISAQGVISRAQPVIGDISGLTAALAAKADDNLAAHLAGTEIFTGAKTFSTVPTFILVPAADGAIGSTSVASIFRGAVGTSISPESANTPVTYLQAFRTGGTHEVAMFGESSNFNLVGVSAADTYPWYRVARYYQNMTGTTDAVSYFHEVNRVLVDIEPTNIGSRSLHFYGYTTQMLKKAAVRSIGVYAEQRNTYGNASLSNGSIDSSWHYTTSNSGSYHNTGLWFSEGPSHLTSAYYGFFLSANSVVGRAHDYTELTANPQGTWTYTNGSPTLTGVGGHADVEVYQGDWLFAGGIYVQAAAGATANSIPLVTNYPGSSGSGSISKSVQTIWMRKNAPIMALNNAGTAKLEMFRLDENDFIRQGYGGTPTYMGGYTSYGSAIPIGAPSDTLTTGWRQIDYDGGSGGRSGRGVESGFLWDMAPSGYKIYVTSSSSPVEALRVTSTGSLLIGLTTQLNAGAGIEASGTGASTLQRALAGTGGWQSVAQVRLKVSSGTASNNGGPALLYYYDDDAGNPELMARSGARWDNVANGSEAARWAVSTRSTGDATAGTERLIVSSNGLTSTYYGASVASASSITPTGNSFTITGTTQIATIVTTNVNPGTTLYMVTTSAGLIFDETGNLDITNATTLTSTANGLVIAVWDGTKWRVR
jgi:hypothetical protein